MAAAGTTINMKLLFDRIFGISVAQIRVHAEIPLKNDTNTFEFPDHSCLLNTSTLA